MPITKYFCRIKPEEMPPKDNPQPNPDPKKTAGGKEEAPEKKSPSSTRIPKQRHPWLRTAVSRGWMTWITPGETLVGRESGHAK